jgi:hypothetical protein
LSYSRSPKSLTYPFWSFSHPKQQQKALQSRTYDFPNVGNSKKERAVTIGNKGYSLDFIDIFAVTTHCA